MNQVQDRFVSYKTSVDGLWMRSLADLSVPGNARRLALDLVRPRHGRRQYAVERALPLVHAADRDRGEDADPSGFALRMTRRPSGSACTVDGIDLLTIPQIRITLDYSYPDVPIGSLSYHTDNYYWIQQNYYYKTRRRLPRAAG